MDPLQETSNTRLPTPHSFLLCSFPCVFPLCSSVLPLVKVLAAPDSPTELFSLSMRIIFRRSCPHGRLSALVFSLRAVLACRLAGADPLSDRVAAVAALPVGRHRRPWSARPGLGRSDASRATAQRTVSSFPRLKGARSSTVMPLEVRRLVFPVASQLICKFPYLFFPRHIDDSFRIVVKAFAQKSSKSRLEFCLF